MPLKVRETIGRTITGLKAAGCAAGHSQARVVERSLGGITEEESKAWMCPLEG